MTSSHLSPESLFSKLKKVAPFPPIRDFNTLERGSVAVIAPHPDDEIIGCGGAIALHAERGDDVCVIFVTDGAGGDRDDVTRGRVREVRQRESKEAGKWVGVNRSIQCDLPDGKIIPDLQTVSLLQSHLGNESYRYVYAPSPFECHPDHLASGMAAAIALSNLKSVREGVSGLESHSPSGPSTMLLYEINQPQLPSFLVDITGVAERKRRALACFTSQIRYIDVVSKAMGGSYARTVNVDLPKVLFAEAYRELDPSSYLSLANSVWQCRL